jgi:hypothetical protein
MIAAAARTSGTSDPLSSVLNRGFCASSQAARARAARARARRLARLERARLAEYLERVFFRVGALADRVGLCADACEREALAAASAGPISPAAQSKKMAMPMTERC